MNISKSSPAKKTSSGPVASSGSIGSDVRATGQEREFLTTRRIPSIPHLENGFLLHHSEPFDGERASLNLTKDTKVKVK